MILTIMNTKGGVAKSTTVINLAAVVSLCKKKVLVIDLDSQGDTTDVFYDKNQSSTDIRALLLENADINEAIQHTVFENIDIIPCGPRHKETLGQLYRMNPFNYHLLREKIAPVVGKYDLIIIDTSPAGFLLTDLALAAADYVATPAMAEGYSYKGMMDVVNQIYKIQGEYNHELVFLGSFLTYAQYTTNLFKTLYRNYLDKFRTSGIKTFIRMDNSLKEAATRGIPVLFYTKRSKGGADYICLAKELRLITKREFEKLMSVYGAEAFDFASYVKEVCGE